MDPRLRSHLLEEWRGLPQDEIDFSSVKTTADLVPALLKSLGLANRLDEQEINAAWKETVGEFLAAHSQPAGLKNGTLLIRVHQPAVRFELERSWKHKILEALRARFPAQAIREVRFIR